MGVDLIKKWPSVAVSPVGIFSALNKDWSSAIASRGVPCPVDGCGTLILPRLDPDVVYWFPCFACGWGGDIFEYYMMASKISDPAAAVAALKAAGIRVKPGADRPGVIGSYQKHIDLRYRFRSLNHTMMGRRVGGRVDAPVMVAARLTQLPHNHPYWWCTTASELHEFIHHAVPGTTAIRRLWMMDDDEYAGTPVLAVPATDKIGRVMGIWAAGRVENDSPAWVWRKAKVSTGLLGFRHAANNTGPNEWRGVGVITSVNRAIHYHVNHLRDDKTPPPVVAAEFGWSASDSGVSVAKSLPNRPWVIATEKSTTLSNLQIIEWIKLGRRLDAKVISTIDQIYEDNLDVMINLAEPWQKFAEHIVLDHNSDWIATLTLSGIGWNSDLEEQVRPFWSKSSINRANQLTKRNNQTKEVTLPSGTIVAQTERGWIDSETGQVLAYMIPVNVRVYRDGRGRTRYTGSVQNGPGLVEFDSARFLKAPIEVVYSAALRRGWKLLPPFHPKVAKHVAELALWFSRS